jgi:hypothetical protein
VLCLCSGSTRDGTIFKKRAERTGSIGESLAANPLENVLIGNQMVQKVRFKSFRGSGIRIFWERSMYFLNRNEIYPSSNTTENGEPDPSGSVTANFSAIWQFLPAPAG